MNTRTVNTTSTLLHPGLESTRGYEIHAVDGHIGHVHDWYFDDQSWVVRFLVVDTGNWLSGRRTLISPAVLGDPQPEGRRLSTSLTREQVRTSPDWDEELPVSLQHQIDLQRHYGWPSYWPASALAGTLIMPGAPSGPPADAEDGRAAEGAADVTDLGDPHLRSLREVCGYRIHASDGELGRASDALAEHGTWILRYLVVDTRNWLPGRKVLLSTAWIDRIEWGQAAVYVHPSREGVRHSPTYAPERPLERDYETLLHEHYDLPKYWL